MPAQEPTAYALGLEDSLVIGIVVLFVGAFINRKVRFLSENYIPPAVTGGLLCSHKIVGAARIGRQANSGGNGSHGAELVKSPPVS